mmetsp:Transcript_10317/g.12876  ORF Transcript_10317/g.12876 Transcript_10317/m.12876 type:complete len:83 (-) Transcript_10317:225-473(-)
MIVYFILIRLEVPLEETSMHANSLDDIVEVLSHADSDVQPMNVLIQDEDESREIDNPKHTSICCQERMTEVVQENDSSSCCS